MKHDDFIEFHVIEIMDSSTKEERNKREEWYIAQYYDNQDKCYNFKQKATGKERSCFSKTPEETISKRVAKLKGQKRTLEQREKMSAISKGRTHTEKSKQKISKSLKGNKRNFGKHLSTEVKQKISNANKGKKLSEETKKKIGEQSKGRHHSEETKKKISVARKGKKLSAEIRKKISENNGMKGKKLSDEARKNLSEINKGNKYNLGKHLSDETKRKMSEAHKGLNTWTKGRHLSEEHKKKLSETHKKLGLRPPSRKGQTAWNKGTQITAFDIRKKLVSASFVGTMKKLKPGALIQINNALDFLWRGSKQKDYFDLYIPLLEEAIALVLKPCILCGDSRFGCRDMYLSTLDEFPEFYKNLESYDIVSTLTPCVEVLHEDKILYLECELFLTALHKKWIEVLQ